MKKIRRDAARVVERARYVIIVDGNGTILDTRLNEQSRVDILAVIGPADIGNGVIADAVLLEIGLFRARPYCRLVRTPERGHEFRPRRKVMGLNEQQLRAILPRIETLLTDYAIEKQMRWKTSVWPILIQKTRIGNRKRRTIRESGYFYGRKGVRFSVSREDGMFMDAVVRSQSHESIAGAARFAGLCLNRHVYESPDDVKRLAFKKGHNGIKTLVESLRERDHRPPWHYAAILKELALQRSHAREKTALFKRILLDFRLTDEEELREARNFLDNTGPRFRGATILVVSQRTRLRHLVFELLPPAIDIDGWRRAIGRWDWWELEGPPPFRETG
ncbi:MAG: hypothetical protein HYS43_00550 [Candidatus Liptonbacteria bacterium]|nr:hypothetical protein [Candidatus Liptonbacteria bacterium]